MKLLNYFCVLTVASPLTIDRLLDGNNLTAISDEMYMDFLNELLNGDYDDPMGEFSFRETALKYDLFNDTEHSDARPDGTSESDTSKMELILLNELYNRESNYSMVNEFVDTDIFQDLVEMMLMICGPLGITLNHMYDYIIYEILPSYDAENDILSFITMLQNEYAPEEKCDETNDQVNILFRWMKLVENKSKDNAGDRRRKREITPWDRNRRDASEVDPSWKKLLCHVVLEEDLIQSTIEFLLLNPDSGLDYSEYYMY